jgi:hypothetical protein
VHLVQHGEKMTARIDCLNQVMNTLEYEGFQDLILTFTCRCWGVAETTVQKLLIPVF